MTGSDCERGPCHAPVKFVRLPRVLHTVRAAPHDFSGSELCILDPLIRPIPEPLPDVSDTDGANAANSMSAFLEEATGGDENERLSEDDGSATNPSFVTRSPRRASAVGTQNAVGRLRKHSVERHSEEKCRPVRLKLGRARTFKVHKTKIFRQGADGFGQSNATSFTPVDSTRKRAFRAAVSSVQVCSSFVSPLGALMTKTGESPTPLPDQLRRPVFLTNRSATPACACDVASLKTTRLAEGRDAGRARQKLLKSLGVGQKRILRPPMGKDTARVRTGTVSPTRPLIPSTFTLM